MASENAQARRSESTSENTRDGSGARRGRAPVVLPDRFADVLAGYVAALASAPLSEQSRRTYASKVRQYLVWLAGAEVDGDPLGAADGRDWAVRDYRGYLQSVLKRSPATVNNALAAVDDFYIRRGLGPARAKRAEVPAAAPRALGAKAQIRYLRAVQACESARDRALALVPFYAGTRIAETVALDVDDVRLSARKGVLRVLGKGERLREVPIHPQLRATLTDWLAGTAELGRARTRDAALFLNRRGGRLTVRAAHDVITGIAGRAGLDDRVTAHVLRHSFATTLVRGGTDLVIAAELLGHARLGDDARVHAAERGGSPQGGGAAAGRRVTLGPALSGELEVPAPRGVEADFAAVELVAQLGEPILGEVVGRDPEARRAQLEGAAAGVFAARGEGAEVGERDAAASGVVSLCEVGERPECKPTFAHQRLERDSDRLVALRLVRHELERYGPVRTSLEACKIAPTGCRRPGCCGVCGFTCVRRSSSAGRPSFPGCWRCARMDGFRARWCARPRRVSA